MPPAWVPAAAQGILVRAFGIGWGCHVGVTRVVAVKSLRVLEVPQALGQSQM